MQLRLRKIVGDTAVALGLDDVNRVNIRLFLEEIAPIEAKLERDERLSREELLHLKRAEKKYGFCVPLGGVNEPRNVKKATGSKNK